MGSSMLGTLSHRLTCFLCVPVSAVTRLTCPSERRRPEPAPGACSPHTSQSATEDQQSPSGR